MAATEFSRLALHPLVLSCGLLLPGAGKSERRRAPDYMRRPQERAALSLLRLWRSGHRGRQLSPAGWAGMPPGPEMSCAPRQLRLVPLADSGDASTASTRSDMRHDILIPVRSTIRGSS
jgi:hypothetical protein